MPRRNRPDSPRPRRKKRTPRRRTPPPSPDEGGKVLFELGKAPKEEREVRERRPRPLKLEVVAEGAQWTAVAKPSGMVSTGSRTEEGPGPSALEMLHALWTSDDEAAERPHAVHRLDRETSGLLLFARGREAAARIARAFRRRRVRKEYLALVNGRPPEAEGEIELRLLSDPRKRGGVRVVRHRGKRSRTAWETLESFRGFSLLRVLPRSGRTHQIRCTLAHLGCPVVGDALYGGGDGLFLSNIKRDYRPSKDREEQPLIGRVALHAHKLAVDPDERIPEGIDVEAEPPKDFRVTLERLRRHAEE
ncbi:MAG: RluA family pseudouridine synthase [Planctomycetota bacterium]|jgi:RluA family pseudouridine synthase